MKEVDESIGDDELVDKSIRDDKTGRRFDQRRRKLVDKLIGDKKLVDKSIGNDETGRRVDRQRRNRSTS